MIGLNTASVGMRPYLPCSVCIGLVHDPLCRDRGRKFYADGVDRAARVESDLLIYNKKDAVTVECLGCLKAYQNTCAQLSFDSARVAVFVDAGNVYARVLGGRVHQVFDIIASVVLATGKEIPVNVKIIIER